MAATLKMTHKAIGVEVRRGPYDVVVDGQRAGSVEMNDTIEIPVEPGRHTLQIRSGRNSSRTRTFEAAEGQTVAFRCTGKSFLPIFLASFVVPSLALQLAVKPTIHRAGKPQSRAHVVHSCLPQQAASLTRSRAGYAGLREPDQTPACRAS